MGGGAAGRPRAHPAARLHPDRRRQSEAADAEATRRGRLLGEALGELKTLSLRKAVAGGDGFADGFPTAALAGVLKAKLAQPQLSKADWVKIGAVGRT